MAGWYDEAWSYRVPLTVYSSTVAVDTTVTIPTDLELFWSNVQSDGDDVRVTEADGVTLVTKYDLAAGWNVATRTGSIEVNPRNTLSAKYRPLWLYFGNSSAASAATAYAPAGTGSGKFYLEAPDAARTVVLVAESPDATRPSQTVRKGSAEQIYVYVDITDALIRRALPYEGSDGHEGVQTIDVTATTGGVSATATIVTAATAQPCLVEHAGRQYVRAVLTAGASGTQYTIIVTMTTIANYSGGGVWDSRTLTARFILDVYDVSEV